MVLRVTFIFCCKLIGSRDTRMKNNVTVPILGQSSVNVFLIYKYIQLYFLVTALYIVKL